MAKKPSLNPEDIAAFEKAVQGTKKISYKKAILRTAAPQAKPKKTSPIWSDEAPPFKEDDSLNLVGGEEFIAFKQTGISHKRLRKLRKGQYNVDAVLDLHGLTVENAKVAVYHFLQQCMHNNIQVALIIHGKGHHSQMATLKNKLNHWLRDINIVLAFCSAAPTHGSRGAVYVLLKQNREENSA